MTSKTIHIQDGTLVVLSGLPGSGKSSLKKRATAPQSAPGGYLERAWLSTDELRTRYLGSFAELDEQGVFTDIPQSGNSEIYAMLRLQVQMRLRMGLTCVIDAVNPTEADRRGWAQMAEEAGAPFKVLIVDTSLEECLRSNSHREFRVPEYSVREFHQPAAPKSTQVDKHGQPVPCDAPAGFSLTSEFPHELISREDHLVFEWPSLAHDRYDVIGDVHGLLDELKELLAQAGWSVENDKLSHPQGRKLLFLGDLVDRGTQSLELVRFVKKAVEAGVAEAIKGNHEAKLVKFFRKHHDEGVSQWGSYANAETGIAFVKAKDGAALIDFLHRLPAFKVFTDELGSTRLLFAHANLIRAEPGITPADEYLYGQTGFERLDTDVKYQQRFDAGINKWTLIRGHIPQTSEQENVFSLERHPFQRGELVMLRLDGLVKARAQGLSYREALMANLVTKRCSFDFDEYSAQRFDLARRVNDLVANKMATVQVDETKCLRVFKYSKDTFFKNRWGESQTLLKARGLVLDASGGIVSHPFDKCFNLHENGAGGDLADDTVLVVPEKLNGFLGVVSSHPFKAGDLLVHTQGSFGGEFVEFIQAFITPAVGGQMKKFLAQNDVTLMFEVIHPDDPHIIEYPPEDRGLWLIGVRGKSQDDLAWPEDEVDAAAQAMGLRRPKWERMTKAELLAKCRNEDGLAKLEGWMARADTPEQEHLFKLKTPYYLVTKFLGRLSTKRIAHMFGSPQDFKKTLDEEFFPLVDALTERLTREQMMALSDTDRVAMVRGIVHELI